MRRRTDALDCFDTRSLHGALSVVHCYSLDKRLLLLLMEHGDIPSGAQDAEQKPRLAQGFYKLGGIEAKRFSGIDAEWGVFNSLSEAVDSQLDTIAGSLGRGFMKMPDRFDDAEMLPREKYAGFLERFGFNKDKTSLRKVSKNHIAVSSDVSGTTITEIYQYYDFETQPDALASLKRLNVDGVIVTAANGKSVQLSKSMPEQGFFVQMADQALNNPIYLVDSAGTMSIQSNSLAAMANPASNQYAAYEFFHELRHIKQPALPQYEGEIDSSEYALQMVDNLRNIGINLSPHVSTEQAKEHLEAGLKTYAKKHFPVKYLVSCAMGNLKHT